MNTKQLGAFGEKVACWYLEKKGYRILTRNYSRKWSQGPQKGEIDIVAEKDKIISFVEVKTAAPLQRGGCFPEDKVNFQKQRQLIKIAQDWLSEKKIPLESKWQIDVISITFDPKSQKAKIRHLENAVCQ